MLSLGKLAPGQEDYYVHAVARGAEEYYLGGKEAPGQWVGDGAELLGLDGEVDADELHGVLGHVHPDRTHKLTAARSAPVVAGFDATFCAPKSVSLLYALGDPEVSNQVRNGADTAIAAAFKVLERAACRVRRGKGGHTVLDGDGFVAAAFRHRTSRAADPHLHTHVVIGNLAYSSTDQKWSALDARPLYSWLSAVGHLYDAQLRWELTTRLGVEWTPVRNGLADIAGIPQQAIREFSTRRREMEAHLEKHGQSSARAAQLAAYATRRPQDTSIETEGLLPVWRDRADRCGLDWAALRAVVDRATVIEPPRPDSDAAQVLYQWLASPHGLTEQCSTFGERDVIKAVCNALPHGGRVEEVLDLVEGFLVSDRVVELRPGRDDATIRLRDGTTLAAHTGESRWTTPEILQLEARLIHTAQHGKGRNAGTATPAVLNMVIAEHPNLTGEQTAMVRTICSSGDRIEIVEGVAGAGKTFALNTARQAWEASGYRVIGCSLAARAANQLQHDARIPSATIDRLLGQLDRDRNAVIDTATVVVVDEAAMVGTRKLARLIDHTTTAGAKVVLVGDSCQLAEIEAGGAFRGLRSRLGATDLVENRRQTETWERHALADLRAGDPGEAIDTYLAHDRVHTAATDRELRDQLVEEWMNSWVEGNDVLMVAPRLADVDDLNHRARTILRDEGYIDHDQVVLNGRGYTEGDHVLALRNDYRIGVLNGTRGIIARIDPVTRTLDVDTDGQHLRIPFTNIEAGHLTHGYATTIHKAQGATVDRCLVLLDDTATREHAYTALSRGRNGNDVFIVDADQRADERHTTEVEPDPVDVLRAVAHRSGSQKFAIDQTDSPSTSPLDELRTERDLLRQHLGAGPPDRRWELRDLSRDRQAEQHYLDGARWRRDVAQQQLDKLGPVRRLTHRSERHELENRIARFEREIGGHEAKLDRLDRALDTIAPDIDKRAAWEHHHQPELERIATLDRQIDRTERLERALSRTLEQGLDRGLERGLGLGL